MAEKEEEKKIEQHETEQKTEAEKEENKEQANKVSEYEELNDRYKRVLAEFENYKKRNLKERESLYNSILGDIILGILPALDNLENAVKSECKDEKYKQGVELVQKQFKDFLAKNNVEEIKTEGEKFDPNLHDAVSSVQDSEKESGTILQEYRKGYKIGSKVLRHSMVVVNS